ncbi:MAG: hypothetical protein DLM73_15960, partial [Chthoniobacterales bacterium]
SAILPNDKKQFTLFTVEQNHAKEHIVQVGLENEQEAEISAPELRANDTVVTVGNHELADGMAVAIQKSK